MSTYTARLSPIDQFFPVIYTAVWLCIPSNDPVSAATALRRGLEKTAAQLPFLRGTVSLDQERNYSGITWTDESPPTSLEKVEGTFPAWAELDAQGMPLHRLQAKDFLPTLLQGPYFMRSALPAALFSYAQLDEGLIVTIAVHHHVMDGDAMTFLLDTWAAQTSNTRFAGTSINPHEPRDRYERVVQAFNNESTEGAGKILNPNADFTAPPPSGPPQRPSYTIESRIFSFDNAKLEELRKLLVKDEGISRTLSKNTIVCALLWYFVNKARLVRLQEDPAGKGSSSLMVQRVSAPATVDMTLFLSTPQESSAKKYPNLLPTLITTILSALTAVTVPKLAAAAKAALEIPDARSLRNVGELLTGRNIVTTTWANLAFWPDFGEKVGKPTYVRIPGLGFDGLATVLPVRRHVLGQGAPLEIIVILREEDIKMLEADEGLTAWLTGKAF